MGATWYYRQKILNHKTIKPLNINKCALILPNKPKSNSELYQALGTYDSGFIRVQNTDSTQRLYFVSIHRQLIIKLEIKPNLLVALDKKQFFSIKHTLFDKYQLATLIAAINDEEASLPLQKIQQAAALYDKGYIEYCLKEIIEENQKRIRTMATSGSISDNHTTSSQDPAVPETKENSPLSTTEYGIKNNTYHVFHRLVSPSQTSAPYIKSRSPVITPLTLEHVFKMTSHDLLANPSSTLPGTLKDPCHLERNHVHNNTVFIFNTWQHPSDEKTSVRSEEPACDQSSLTNDTALLSNVAIDSEPTLIKNASSSDETSEDDSSTVDEKATDLQALDEFNKTIHFLDRRATIYSRRLSTAPAPKRDNLSQPQMIALSLGSSSLKSTRPLNKRLTFNQPSTFQPQYKQVTFKSEPLNSRLEIETRVRTAPLLNGRRATQSQKPSSSKIEEQVAPINTSEELHPKKDGGQIRSTDHVSKIKPYVDRQSIRLFDKRRPSQRVVNQQEFSSTIPINNLGSTEHN